MTWLREYLGSIAMALLLAVLTWAWLYSESTATRSIEFEFKPQIGVELAESDFAVQDGVLREGRIRVDITGPRAIVDAQRSGGFPCAPAVPNASFSAEQGTVTLSLKREDFSIPPTVAIKALPTVLIAYVRYVDLKVDLEARPADLEDDPPPGWRVVSIRPLPASILVRVPANRRAALPARMPVEKVRISGRTPSFEDRGRIESPVPGVRQIQEFSLAVTLEKAPVLWTVQNVELNLSGRDDVLRKTKLSNPRTVVIQLQGPAELKDKVQPSDLHAYVRVPPLPAGKKSLDTLGCDVVNPKYRAVVQVVTIMSDVPESARTVEIEVSE